MRINTYTICNTLCEALKSKELAGTEMNALQVYSLANFGVKTKIYNQIAINKTKYQTPYISVSTIAQKDKVKDMVGIDIDFAIPVAGGVKEQEINGIISYVDREKVEEFADIIVGLVEKACVSYADSDIIFSPNPIEFEKKEFSGNIEITYQKSILLKRDR